MLTIFHNPACGTSRNTLALIRAAGSEPVVVEYLKTPPDRATLERVAAMLGGVRPMLREKAPPFTELGLADTDLSDAALLDAIQAHPVLINRPIVFSKTQARVCRPAAIVQELIGGLGSEAPASSRA